jgi:hypothetical protein
MDYSSDDINQMSYGPISPNESINHTIYECFKYIHQEDVRKFLKEFKQLPNESDQILHTFRELILGAFLNSHGFPCRYNYQINNNSPDWCITENDSHVVCIVELTNFHIDRVTEKEIQEKLRSDHVAVVWKNPKPNIDRLYQCIWNKAQLYKDLIDKLEIPYVVSIFRDFIAPANMRDVRFCLFNEDTGLFKMYPRMSGVLFFQDTQGR